MDGFPLALEDSETLGQLLARHELLYGEVKTFKDISALIDAVTVEDLKRVAETLFTNDALYLAVIGPYEDKERFEKLLKF